jgi:hypothetical protein
MASYFISSSVQAIAQVLMDFGNLRTLLDEATVSASKTNADNAAKQAMEMQNIHELALTTSEVLRDTNVKEIMQVHENLPQSSLHPN